MVYLLVSMPVSGISIVLDLTPNYKGREVWFSNVAGLEEPKIKDLTVSVIQNDESVEYIKSREQIIKWGNSDRI